MYEAKLKFPEGWVRSNPFCGGGMDMFWNYKTINISRMFENVNLLVALLSCRHHRTTVQWVNLCRYSSQSHSPHH